MVHSDDSDGDEGRTLLGRAAAALTKSTLFSSSVRTPAASVNDSGRAGSAPVSSSGLGSLDPDHDVENVRHLRVTPAHRGVGRAAATGFGPRVQHYQFAALAAYWFGWSFLWLPLLIVLIPFQILSLAPNQQSKGSALGSTLLLGSFVSLFCAPLFGSWSDSSRHPMVSCALGQPPYYSVLRDSIALLTCVCACL